MSKDMDPARTKRVPRFVEEYCVDENGTRAALRAGWPASWASQAAYRLLNNPQVQKMIEERKAEMSKAVDAKVEDILRQWLDIATADPSKLMRVRRVNCRHCWGIGHEYQWGAREYAKACDAAANAVNPKTGEPAPRPMPDCAGGFDWKFNAEPNPECPECLGEGIEETFVADLESLSGPERRLFAGVKLTRNGPEVVMHDQAAALANLAKFKGMLVDRKELTGKDGKDLLTPTTIIVTGPDSGE